MSDLQELRRQIDRIDSELVNLLKERAALVLQVRAAKKKGGLAAYAPEREQEIYTRVRSLAADGAFPLDSLEKIFRSVVSATRSLLGELLISYLGPECSFAYDAAVKQFGQDAYFTPAGSVDDVFRRVAKGEVHFGVVPIELTSSGLVQATFEAFLRSDLQIVAEVGVPRELVIASQAACGLADVRAVYAEAHAFADCANWIRVNVPTAQCVVVHSGTMAVCQIKESDSNAAILSRSTAERADLYMLAHALEDEAGANGRFLIVGNQTPGPTGRDKTTVLCSVKDRAGALSEILKPFSRCGVTLTKIDSKPIREGSWEYVFFIDMAGHRTDSAIGEVLNELTGLCSEVKILGSYPMSCV